MRNVVALVGVAATLVFVASAASAAYTPYDGVYHGHYNGSDVPVHFTVDSKRMVVEHFTRGSLVLFASTPLVYSSDRWKFDFRGTNFHVHGGWVSHGQVYGTSCHVSSGGCDRGSSPDAYSAANPRPAQGTYTGTASDGRTVHFTVRPPLYDASLLVVKDLWIGDHHVFTTAPLVENSAGAWHFNFHLVYHASGTWTDATHVHGRICVLNVALLCRAGEDWTFNAHHTG